MNLCLKTAAGEEENGLMFLCRKKMAGVTENMCNFAVAIAGNSDTSSLKKDEIMVKVNDIVRFLNDVGGGEA